jgi:hypothetical protein
VRTKAGALLATAVSLATLSASAAAAEPDPPELAKAVITPADFEYLGSFVVPWGQETYPDYCFDNDVAQPSPDSLVVADLGDIMVGDLLQVGTDFVNQGAHLETYELGKVAAIDPATRTVTFTEPLLGQVTFETVTRHVVFDDGDVTATLHVYQLDDTPAPDSSDVFALLKQILALLQSLIQRLLALFA